jgi:hypothetical protein
MFKDKVNSISQCENHDSGSRVREWRLGIDLVSILCHLEPDVRFSLIRLSDNLLPAAFKVRLHIYRVGRSILNPVDVVRL